jgi:predicted esterase
MSKYNMPYDIQTYAVPTLTHGRVLMRSARAAARRGLLIGFHGYAENAAMQMKRLEAIPGASAWTLVSIQGLHRFYRGRTEDVVASWMTREDRDITIADNLAYVASAFDGVPHDDSTRIVYAGFSQGVAMAFHAAVLGRDRASGVIAIGGDVPPDLLADRAVRFPPVFLARGERDEWFTQLKFDADVAALTARGASPTSVVYDGAHEWNAAVATAAGEFLAHDDPTRK